MTLFFTIACWDKQEHEISLPEFPHYVLSGYTVDIDNPQISVPNTILTIFPIQLIYDVIFTPLTIEADSTGYFEVDSIFPGTYTISVQRDGYRVASERIFIAHEDRKFDILIPAPLINDMMYSQVFGSKMVWVGDRLWMFGDSIYQCYISNGVWGYDGVLSNPIPNPDGLVNANGRVYASKYDSVALLSTADGSLITKLKADDPMRGLAWADSGFWTTLGYYFQNRGPDIRTEEESYLTTAEVLGPLDYNNGHFWSYDRYRDLLLKLDQTGTILKTYRPIDVDTGQWITINDLSFEYRNKLWALGSNIYIFNVE